MSDERRYREDEVKRIFEAASAEPDARPGSAASSDAMTLRELQEIGREVGITPERIAAAAREVESRPTAEPRSVLPIAVRQIVAVPRAPTESEWLMLVTELRTTFDAAGKVGTTAGIREWRNGNLHAFIEPTTGGYRLRMGTRNGSRLGLAVTGVLGIAWSAAVVVGFSIAGAPDDGFLVPAIVSVLGAGAMVTGIARMRSWARTRAEQFESLARKVQAMLAAPPDGR